MMGEEKCNGEMLEAACMRRYLQCDMADMGPMRDDYDDSMDVLAKFCLYACACMGACVWVTFCFPCSTDVRCQVSDPVLLVTITSCKCMERLLCVVDLKGYLLGCIHGRGGKASE